MVVREQLGPGMGDQAVVAINNENPENGFFDPEYAQYAQYAVYNMQNMRTMNLQNMQNMQINMQTSMH